LEERIGGSIQRFESVFLFSSKNCFLTVFRQMSKGDYTGKPLITEEGREGVLSDWREAFVISGRYGMGDRNALK